jgi:hypothetical protein
VAVTVEQHAPFVVLDDSDRIVEVGREVGSQFGPLVGEIMWDCFPGSEPLFKPYYDRARTSGEPVEFVQFYGGNVARIRAVPHGDGRLDLFWEALARLDTLTLGGLVDSLERSLALLDVRSAALERRLARKAFQVIEGGR